MGLDTYPLQASDNGLPVAFRRIFKLPFIPAFNIPLLLLYKPRRVRLPLNTGKTLLDFSP
jgi:hypothetical protein